MILVLCQKKIFKQRSVSGPRNGSCASVKEVKKVNCAMVHEAENFGVWLSYDSDLSRMVGKSYLWMRSRNGFLVIKD